MTYNRQYYLDNRERFLATQKKYVDNHKEKKLEYDRRYNKANKEKKQEQNRLNRIKYGGQPMSENRTCSQFLGIHVAERMLSYLFKDVVRMPNNNPGYDFKCAKDYLIDVKSSCQRIWSSGTIRWQFNIYRNTIADYFLCLAFDNREDLNPLHIWLIPGDVLSHLVGTSISKTTLDKWVEYEKPIDKATTCCNSMK